MSELQKASKRIEELTEYLEECRSERDDARRAAKTAWLEIDRLKAQLEACQSERNHWKDLASKS